MPKPVEICLEELNGDRKDEPFVRCVALPGGQPVILLKGSKIMCEASGLTGPVPADLIRFVGSGH